MLKKIFELIQRTSDERYRKALLTTVMNVAGQGVQLLTGLISVPLTLNYIGTERFGVWMTISTALAFITFSDFGVGIGVQNTMATALATKDYSVARRSFFTTFCFVSFLCVLLIIVSQILIPRFNFANLFSLKSPEAIQEIVPTIQTVFIVFGLGLLSGIVQRAFNALQEGFVIALIQILTRLCSLGLLFWAVDEKMGLPGLTFIISGIPNISILLFGLVILVLRNQWLNPTRHFIQNFFDLNSLKRVLRIGMMGLGAMIAVYFINNSIPFLISTKYGAESVADYSVMLRITGIPTILLTYILLPLWPAITEAVAKDDIHWIKTAYRKYSFMTLIISLITAIPILFFGRFIIRLWTGNEAVVPDVHLLISVVAFMVIGYWNALSSVILNGLSKFRGQATYGLILAIVFASIAYLLPNTWGKESVVWVILSGYLIRCIAMQVELSSYFKKSTSHCPLQPQSLG